MNKASLEARPSWAMSRMSEPGGITIWPPVDVPEWSIDRVLTEKHLVILGQRGFGITAFLNDSQQVLEDKAYLYAVGTPQGLSVRKHGKARDADPRVAQLASAFDSHLGTPDALNEQRKALREDIAKHETSIWLILRDLRALGMDPAGELVGELRGLSERWPDRLVVVTVDQSEALFTGSEHGSTFMALGHEYLLGWLDSARVLGHAKGKGLDRFNSDYPEVEFVGTVLRHTGGVLVLVDDLLHRISILAKANEPLRRDKVLQAVRDQRSAPPPQTGLWQQGLREILSSTPDLTRRLRAYVAGQTLDMDHEVPPGIERPLFIGGWARERGDEGGRHWGISSTLHASLARAVLDDLVPAEVPTSPPPVRPA